MRALATILVGLLLYVLCAGQVGPQQQRTILIPGSNITITTNAFNRYTIASSGGVTNYGTTLTNVVIRSDAGNALTINTNALVVDTNNVRIGGVMTATNANFYGQTNLGTVYVGDGTLQILNASGVMHLKRDSAGTAVKITRSDDRGHLLLGNNIGGGDPYSIFDVSGPLQIRINGSTAFLELGMTTGIYGLGGSAVTDTGFKVGATGLQFRTGTDSAYTNITAQVVFTQTGTATNLVRAPGVVYQSITSVGNVGAGEDDLISQSVNGGILANNGDRMRILCPVTFAANANNKTVKAYWAGVSFYSTGALAINGDTAVFEFIITRTGATTQNITTRVSCGDALMATLTSDFDTGAATLANANIFKLTGEATDNDDISQKEMMAEILPAP